MAVRLAALALSLLIMSGCAGLGAYRDPVRVTVSNIRILESTLLEQLYQVTLRIQNHNAEPIEIRGGSFDLAINGKDFGSGVTDGVVTVPAYADAQIDVRMVSTMFGMLRVIQSLQGRDDARLEYEISGRFSVEGKFGGLGFHEAGEVELPRRSAQESVP